MKRKYRKIATNQEIKFEKKVSEKCIIVKKNMNSVAQCRACADKYQDGRVPATWCT